MMFTALNQTYGKEAGERQREAARKQEEFKIQKKLADFAKEDEMQNRFNLEYHNPSYFVYGEPSSKLQISFKYSPLKKIPLYLGYTQLGFWHLRDDSKPFKDFNYNPEIFYTLDLNDSFWKEIDFAPYEHKSNGSDGKNSRSFD
ncbi:MAG: phospholipase A, partial [Pseudobdellovibrionaceae bacterium]